MGCATYLLFHPEDSDMKNNKQYFTEKLGIPAEKFVADPAAVDYLKHVNEIKSLKSFVDTHYKRVREASKGQLQLFIRTFIQLFNINSFVHSFNYSILVHSYCLTLFLILFRCVLASL